MKTGREHLEKGLDFELPENELVLAVSDGSDSEGESLLRESILRRKYTALVKGYHAESIRTNSGESLGKLLNRYMEAKNMTPSILSERFGIAGGQLFELIDDQVIANQIPLLKLHRLLEELDIPWNSAQRSIWITFNRLQKEAEENDGLSNLQLAARIGRRGSRQEEFPRNLGFEHLFFNADSLEKYLTRLGQLFSSQNIFEL